MRSNSAARLTIRSAPARRTGRLADGRSNALLKTLDQRGTDIVEMVVGRSESLRTLSRPATASPPAADPRQITARSTADRLARPARHGSSTVVGPAKSRAPLKPATASPPASPPPEVHLKESQRSQRNLRAAPPAPPTSSGRRLPSIDSNLPNLSKIEKVADRRPSSTAIGHAVETQLSAGELGDQ
jgi:hypothetical protein